MFLQILCFTILVAVSTSEKIYYDHENAEELFEEFLQTYSKEYEREEKLKRLEIFRENLKEINRLNSIDNAIFDINEFTDFTTEEMTANYGFVVPELNLTDSCKVLEEEMTSFTAPESLDYRQKNVITEVKHQKKCQSCWIFASIGSIEAAHAIKHGELISLSEQQLMNCLRCSRGCSTGGYMVKALSELTGQGVMKEADYPYIGRDQQCLLDRSRTVVKVAGCYQYKLKSENQLKEYLFKNGPIAIAINGYAAQFYRSGIYKVDSCPANSISHAVLLVGYGTENGQDYWIIKNSYGTKFGENGYMRMSRGQNTCGLMNSFAASAIVA